MTATLAQRFVLTADETLVVASRVGVQSLPVVLDLRPQHHTATAQAVAADRVTESLTARGLITAGAVAPGLTELLMALQRPERELAMRLVTPDGVARIAVLRKGAQCISARRIGQEVVLELADPPADLPRAVRLLSAHLPSAPAADVPAVGAPLEAFGEALTGSHDATVLADRIRSLGAEVRTAMFLGSALASRQAFAEIVYYALDPEEERVLRSPTAVAVFYTKRGRLVAGSSASPSGELWTTLKPGSDHAIRQAVDQLIELSGNRWGGL